MAASGGDARTKREQARRERRAKASESEQEQGQEQERQLEESRATAGGDGGGAGLTTPKLVVAGAAAGALLGTAKAVLDRRQGHDGVDEAPHEDDEAHDEHEEREQEPHGRGGERQLSEPPTGVRGLLVTVLEAALDAVQEPGQARHERDDDDDERTREEEDDDEEAELQPRDEQTEDGRPAARGEGDEVGQPPEEDEGDEEEDRPETAAGAEPDEPIAERAHGEGDEDDREDEEPERRVGERELDGDAEPIVAARNGHGGTADVLARAKQQIAILVGREPESASRVEHVDGGWRLAFEVVEVPRIPPTTDVMASYSVALDESGNVLEYGRTHRYYRNRAEHEGLE